MSSRLILASASPQRTAILDQLGVPHEVRPAGVEELDCGDPVDVVRVNARRKALAVPGALVLGCDTDVTIDGEVIGKPAGAEEALAMLRRLAGRTHEVHGGVCVVRDGTVAAQGVATTRVTLKPVDPAWYVGTREWEGRAGAYAIQGRGALLIDRIEGDYLNVVGLPVALLADIAPEVVGLGRP